MNIITGNSLCRLMNFEHEVENWCYPKIGFIISRYNIKKGDR